VIVLILQEINNHCTWGTRICSMTVVCYQGSMNVVWYWLDSMMVVWCYIMVTVDVTRK